MQMHRNSNLFAIFIQGSHIVKTGLRHLEINKLKILNSSISMKSPFKNQILFLITFLSE